MLTCLKTVFTKFRLKFFAVIFDLARCYRSIHSSQQTNRCRLMWWITNPEEAGIALDEAMHIFMLERMTYGDIGASTGLELAIRKIIAPECKTALGRSILSGDRYVDDIWSSHHCAKELLEAIDDIELTLLNHGFRIKRIISNQLWYHDAKNLLADKLTSVNGLFTSSETSEITFGHSYDWGDDKLMLI